MQLYILYIDPRSERHVEVKRALESVTSKLQFASSQQEACQRLDTAKMARSLPDLVFLAWAGGLAEALIRTMKNDFVLRPIPVIVLAPRSTSDSEIKLIYDLYANAVVQDDDELQLSHETFRRIAEFWRRILLSPHP